MYNEEENKSPWTYSASQDQSQQAPEAHTQPQPAPHVTDHIPQYHYAPQPIEPPKPKKKKSVAGKVIALALCCSLVGGILGAIGGAVGGSIFVFLVMMAAVWLISIWLQPYLTGSVAGFYLNFKPQEPVQFEN